MLRKQKGIRTGDVEYLKIPEMRPYQQEKEFRVILGSGQKLGKLDIEIPITTINRITLSPWLHRSLYPNIKRMLKSIPGCEALEVVRSTLISNDEWKEFGESACGK